MPRVPLFLVQLDSQTTPFYSVRLAQDQAPCLSDSSSSCSGSRLVFRMLGDLRVISCLYQPWSSATTPTPTSHSRHVPVAEDQPDSERERCVSMYLEWELDVDPVTLREFEDMIRKNFVGPGPYPTYILPSTRAEEVDPVTHCQPLRSPVAYESVAAVRAGYPSPPKPVLPQTPPWRI